VRRALGAAFGALLAGGAAADDLTAHGRALALAAEPVTLGAGELAPGLALAGAWELRAEDAAFGGLSGTLCAPRLHGLGRFAPQGRGNLRPMLAGSLQGLPSCGAPCRGGSPAGAVEENEQPMARDAGRPWIDGVLHPDFHPVVRALREQLRGSPGGAAVCVYHRGECVVDLWGGRRDRRGRRV